MGLDWTQKEMSLLHEGGVCKKFSGNACARKGRASTWYKRKRKKGELQCISSRCQRKASKEEGQRGLDPSLPREVDRLPPSHGTSHGVHPKREGTLTLQPFRHLIGPPLFDVDVSHVGRFKGHQRLQLALGSRSLFMLTS